MTYKWIVLGLGLGLGMTASQGFAAASEGGDSRAAEPSDSGSEMGDASSTQGNAQSRPGSPTQGHLSPDSRSASPLPITESAQFKYKGMQFKSKDEALAFHASLANLMEVNDLLGQGANPNSTLGGTPALVSVLASGVARGNSLNDRESKVMNIIHALIEKGADVNAVAKEGSHKDKTPLMVAAYVGRLDAVKYLLSKKANRDLTSEGKTALQWAEEAKQMPDSAGHAKDLDAIIATLKS